MRVPCRGEKEAQRGAPALCRTASGTCALSVPTPPAPEPLPSTVLGPARPPPPHALCRTQKPEDTTANSGKTGCPVGPANTQAVDGCCLEALPTASCSLQHPVCLDAPWGFYGPPLPLSSRTSLTLALPTQVHLWG